MTASNGHHLPGDKDDSLSVSARRAIPDADEMADDFLSQLDIFRLLNILRKNIVALLLIPAVCLAGGFVFLRYTKPIYESSSSLRLAMKSDARVLGLNVATPAEDVTSNLSGEIELIKSDLIYEEVIKRMDMGVSYYAKGDILDEERYKSSPFEVIYDSRNPAVFDQVINLQILSQDQYELEYSLNGKEYKATYAFNKPASTGDFTFIIRRTPQYVPEFNGMHFYFIINSRDKLFQYLTSNLRVDILNPSANIIGIAFKEYTIAKAQDIVNTVDTVYLEKTLELKNKANKQKMDFLEKQLLVTEKKLESYELLQEDFLVENKTADVREDLSKYVGKIEELLQQKMELTTQLALLKDLRRLIDTENNLTNFIPSLPLLPDPQLATLTGEINELQKERALLLTTSKESTFAVKSKNKAIAIAKRNLTTLITRNEQLIGKEISQIDRKQREIENTFAGLPAKGTAFTKIQRFKDLYEKYYLLIMDRKAEIGIAEAGTVPEFVVLSTASFPTGPISPKKSLVYIICAIAGIFTSFLLVGVQYIRHNTIADQRDLERNTSAAMLGVIPSYRREKMPVSRLVIDRYPKATISEALRSIRTNLEFIISTKKRKRIISVTSTISGEGKTFVSINLGGVIAMSGARVVILDLDLRKPKIHLAFENNNARGVSTILIGKHAWSDCVHATSIPTMDYIPAGPTPPNPAELILRPEFDALLQSLHESYDIIVIDTPPVGLVTDGILVMKKADLSVYVLRADYSKRAFLKSVNKLKNYHQFTNLALILNDFKDFTHYGYGYGAGYGYGYGYGGYYDTDETKHTPLTRAKDALQKFHKAKSERS